MATKRRKGFERGKYPIYDDQFDRSRLTSHILNREIMPSFHSIIEDKQNLQSLLIERIGDENGKYRKGKNTMIAILPILKAKLADVELRFNKVQRQLVKAGYEELETMPKELLNEKYKLQAEEDVCLEEIDLLEQKIKQFTEAEKHVDDDLVLAYGLKCSGHFHGLRAPTYEMRDQLKDLDGQLISMHEEGFLIIDDPRSPYDGMAVSAYHKLAKQWTLDRLRADQEKLKRLQAEAKAEGKQMPSMMPLHGNKRVDRNSLPKWPQWATNYKQAKEEVKITRKNKITHLSDINNIM